MKSCRRQFGQTSDLQHIIQVGNTFSAVWMISCRNPTDETGTPSGPNSGAAFRAVFTKLPLSLTDGGEGGYGSRRQLQPITLSVCGVIQSHVPPPVHTCFPVTDQSAVRHRSCSPQTQRPHFLFRGSSLGGKQRLDADSILKVKFGFRCKCIIWQLCKG